MPTTRLMLWMGIVTLTFAARSRAGSQSQEQPCPANVEAVVLDLLVVVAPSWGTCGPIEDFE